MTNLPLHESLGGRLDELSERVVALAEINSGTFNADGVDRCGDRLASFLDELAPDLVERPVVEPARVLGPDGSWDEVPLGRALRASKRPDATFQVCLFGHLDTVFAADSPFQTVAIDGHRLHGPGVADCKGGLVQAIEILRHLDQSEWGEQVGWTFLALPDEEIGSASSVELLADAAAGADLGLGFEPSLPSGGVAAARKGSLTAHTIVHGQAAHAGRAHHEGRSAVRGLARLIDALESLNQAEGVTVNCGRIHGGGALNVVPDFALGSYNLRVETAQHAAWVKTCFEELVVEASAGDLDVELIWTGERPPKVRTPQIDQLLTDVGEAGGELGFTIEAEDTGGCCDGNNLAAAGLPNVDSLGIVGGAIHSADEFAHVDSIPHRAAVGAEVIRRAHTRHVESNGSQR